jgi:hypothetical protein
MPGCWARCMHSDATGGMGAISPRAFVAPARQIYGADDHGLRACVTGFSAEVAQRPDGFSYEDMGPVTLNGVTAPIRLFRAAR